jgi:NSS family neurotransmitter:Na+ symporter
VSVLIIFNFGSLFGMVIAITTRYSQPMLGLLMCVFAGWVWHRNTLVAEIKKGMTDGDSRLFWKIWPGYVRYVCPALILAIFIKQLL